MASKDTPMEQAVDNLAESGVRVASNLTDAANALASLPDAAARGVSSVLHGREAVEKVAGKFDPHPLNSLVDRVSSRRKNTPASRA